jgi:hypothetical protein
MTARGLSSFPKLDVIPIRFLFSELNCDEYGNIVKKRR